jgi:6-pyruvoyltetrahydropterin/6-carboxytetrahydropterin synthase
MKFTSTKLLELGSCAFRQPNAKSHCRFLHGYRLTAKFWFGANQLDGNNWVVDFGSLSPLKKLLRDQFDHTTVIDKNDPYIESFQGLNDADVLDLRVTDGVGIEKFAQYCFKVGNDFIKKESEGRCWVDKVEVFEHENNSAIYTENITTTMRFADPETGYQNG